MKAMKKTIAVMLTLCMVFSMLAVAAVSVSAEETEQEEEAPVFAEFNETEQIEETPVENETAWGTQEEAPAVEEPIVEEEDLVITQPESSEEMFDPEKELELFRRKVEQEMGITLEEIEEEERTEYVETVFAEPAPGIVAYEEPEAEASEEPMTLEDLFGEEAAAAEAPAEEPAPAAETAEPAPEAPAKEAKPTAEEDLFKFKPAEAAGVAAAGAAAAAEQTIEQRIAEDTKNPPKDDRITYHDVFAEEIAAEKKGADKAPKKHTGLKVLAVILCILIIAEIVIICIKYMAPDSAAAIQLQDIFNSIYGALSSMMGKLGN